MVVVVRLHDMIQILRSDTFICPMYAGNILMKVQLTDTLKVLTIHPTAFEKATVIECSTIPCEEF
jgi:electron transfer flavoprotein alpha subunit